MSTVVYSSIRGPHLIGSLAVAVVLVLLVVILVESAIIWHQRR